MKTVWKYSFPFLSNIVHGFDIPKGGRIVHVEEDRTGGGDKTEPALAIWVEVDPHAETEWRLFTVYGTGHNIFDKTEEYVGTIVSPPLAIHLYERKDH